MSDKEFDPECEDKEDLDREILDTLTDTPINTPDLRKMLRRRGLKFKKCDMNRTLYRLLDEGKIERCKSKDYFYWSKN